MTAVYNSANLQSEVKNDPAHLGFATLVAAGSIGSISTILNALTGPGAGAVSHEPISATDFMALCDPAELSTLTTLQLQQVAVYTSAGQVAIGSANVQTWINQVWPVGNAPATNAAMRSYFTRTGSRAEVLWGPGTNVSNQDLINAEPLS